MTDVVVKKPRLTCAPWTLGGAMDKDEQGYPLTGDPSFDEDPAVSPRNRVCVALWIDLFRRQLFMSDDNPPCREWYRDWFDRCAAYLGWTDRNIENGIHELTEKYQQYALRAREASGLAAAVGTLIARHPSFDEQLGRDVAELFRSREDELRQRAEMWLAIRDDNLGAEASSRRIAISDEWAARRQAWAAGQPDGRA